MKIIIDFGDLCILRDSVNRKTDDSKAGSVREIEPPDVNIPEEESGY